MFVHQVMRGARAIWCRMKVQPRVGSGLGLLVLASGLCALDPPQLRLETRVVGDSLEATLSWRREVGVHHIRVAASLPGVAGFQWVDTAEDTLFQHRVPATRAQWQVSAVDQAEEAPLAAAPLPSHSAADVIAYFSGSYPCVPVDTWSAPWDQAQLQDLLIQGDAVKRYSQFGFAAMECSSQPVDARDMTHLRLDLWVPEGSSFVRVKLVDFGANGMYGGGDDSEHEVEISATSSPSLICGHWQSLDLPLALFGSLLGRAHISQVLFSGACEALYLDNLYFRRDPAWVPPTQPLEPAPVPLDGAASVISLFSRVYPNHPVDSWSAPWDQSDFGFHTLDGDSMLRYGNLMYCGIECLSHPVDATGMSMLHLDVWTPEDTTPPAALRVKLVDFGANGVWGGGDDVEGQVAVDASGNPPLASGRWVSLDLPLASFTGLSARAHVAQLLFFGGLSTLFVDNLYFHDDCPTWRATPSQGAGWLSQSEPDSAAWSLVWQDEFDGPVGQAPDPGRWTHDVGTGWGNAQLEWDSDRTQNSSLDGLGHLAITALRETFQGCAYTSARLVSRGRFEPTYGRIEARLKTPVGQGLWPAFWLLGSDISTVGWPACGEIDIMELQGQQPDLTLGSLHGPGYSGGGSFTNYFRLPSAGFHQDFHVFGVDWSPGHIVWSVDHLPFASATPAELSGDWVFDHPFTLILNVAVGGAFVGSPDPCTVFPQSMLVDWVRVYESRFAATEMEAPGGVEDQGALAPSVP